MEAEFWLKKWDSNQIGFHDDEIHPMLLRYWRDLDVAAGARVFVPLCGKSNDMLWLRNQGYSIVGVELSKIAVTDFFRENAIAYDITEKGDYTCFTSERLEIICGDYFSLTTDLLGLFSAIYDRAALIALPSDMRREYVKTLSDLLVGPVRSLLITVDYPPSEISPPPFVVSDQEVRELYANWDSVRELGGGDTKVKGLDGKETAYFLRAS